MSGPDRVVYSTGKGRVCSACGWPQDDCHCAKTLAAGTEPVPETVTVKLRLETRASGKHVTVLDGFPTIARFSRRCAGTSRRRAGRAEPPRTAKSSSRGTSASGCGSCSSGKA